MHQSLRYFQSWLDAESILQALQGKARRAYAVRQGWAGERNNGAQALTSKVSKVVGHIWNHICGLVDHDARLGRLIFECQVHVFNKVFPTLIGSAIF